MGKDKKLLAIGSATRLGVRFSNIVLTLVLTPFITRELGLEMWGLWALIGAFLSYYSLTDLGMGASIARFASGSLAKQEYDQCNKYLSTAFAVYSGMGAVMALVTFAIAGGAYVLDLPQGNGEVFAHVIVVMGLSFAIGMPLQVYGGALSANLRFDLLSYFQCVAIVIRTGLVVAFLLGGLGILGLAYASMAASLSSYVITIFASHRVLPQVRVKHACMSRATAREMFSYSSWVTVANITSIVRFRIDALVITICLGLTPTGIYQIASMFAMHLHDGMNSIFGILFPYFSRLNASEQHEKLVRAMFFTTRRAIQIAMLGGFAMIAWGQDFLTWWLEPAYADAYPSLVVLVTCMCFACGQMPLYHYLFGLSKSKFFAITHGIEAAMNLSISLILINFTTLGILGVALGTMIPMIIVQVTVLPIYACRQLGIKPTTYFLFVLRVVLVSLIGLAIPTMVAFEFSKPNLVLIIAEFAISAVAYLLVVWAIESMSFERAERRNPLRWFLAVPSQV